MRHCAPAACWRGDSHLSLIADTKPKGTTHGSLADERPDLVLQWVPESNGSQTPQSVSAESQYKATWRCGRGCEHCGTLHEWTARVSTRTLTGSGCPLCSGVKICSCRSVAAMYPDLMKQWDWERNQPIDPQSIGCYSNTKVSWICTEHGSWDAASKARVGLGSGCPKCARQQRLGSIPQQRGFLKHEMPGVYAELHPNKNSGVDVERLTCGSGRRVWWLCQSNQSRPEGCQHDHVWEAPVRDRCALRKPTSCPFCTGLLVCPCKSLAELQPGLLQFWDFAGNVVPLAKPIEPSRLGVNSTRKVWWRHECAEGQVCHWLASPSKVVRRVKASGQVPCPHCAPARRAATFAERRRELIKRR